MRLLALFLLLSVAGGSFAAVDVEKAAIGMDGFARAERWVPVVFQLRNPGADFQGTLEVVKGQTIFKKSVDLAAGAKRQVEVLYYHANYYEPLNYTIQDPTGRVVAKNRLDPSTLNYQDNLIVVVSDTEYNHQFLNAQQNPWGGKTYVAYLKSEQLPVEWIALSSADAIAIGDLSPAQIGSARWQALLTYAASGGVLVLSGGTSLGVTQDRRIASHLPWISASFDRAGDGAFLVARWARAHSEQFPKLEIPFQSLRPRAMDRELIVQQDRSVLATSSDYYKGNIIYVTFDYTRLPEEIRTTFAGFWNDMVFPSAPNPPAFTMPFRKRLEENARVQKFLYDIPGLRLPKVEWFALFFFIYVFALGPFQWFLLRILKRSSLLWIFFPAIIILFSLSTLGYSRARQSSENRITQTTVLEVFPDIGRQNIDQVYATAMADSGTFRFQALPENSFLRKHVMQSRGYQPEPFTLSEDLPHELVGETLKTWTFRSFGAFASEPQQIAIEVNVFLQNGQLTGTIRNQTSWTLENSFFVYDFKNVASTGSLSPGEHRSFSLLINDHTAPPWAEPHLRDLLHLYSNSYSHSHFFFANVKEDKGTLYINGKPHATSMQKYVAVYVMPKTSGQS